MNFPNKDGLKKALAQGGTEALTEFANGVHPGLGAATQICASLFGAAMEHRQDRAAELIVYVREHIAEFSPQLLEDKVFQDGFVWLMEKYIRERNDDKRVILQKILLGYIKAPNLLDYPLEEMTDLVSRVRMADVSVFRTVLAEEAKLVAHGTNADQRSFMVREDPNAVSRLIYFGLLHEDRSQSGPQIREHDDKNYLYVWVSPTGREFNKYLNRPVDTSPEQIRL